MKSGSLPTPSTIGRPCGARLSVSADTRVAGSITGAPYETERALDFRVLTDARPMIETMPLENAVVAYQKVRSGDVRFRMVLVMGNADNTSQVVSRGRLES